MNIKTEFDLSIYELSKETWDRIADEGFPHLRDMAKHFGRNVDMDAALGYANAVSRWRNGYGLPCKSSDRRARLWLENRAAEAANPPQSAETAKILMVTCATGAVAEKALKVLAVLGCEVVEI